MHQRLRLKIKKVDFAVHATSRNKIVWQADQRGDPIGEDRQCLQQLSACDVIKIDASVSVSRYQKGILFRKGGIPNRYWPHRNFPHGLEVGCIPQLDTALP